MKTVDGFRKVPSVAFDTTNNGSDKIHEISCRMF